MYFRIISKNYLTFIISKSSKCLSLKIIINIEFSFNKYT